MHGVNQETRMPCPHTLIWQVLTCFLNLWPRAHEMLQAPRYLNPVLPLRCAVAQYQQTICAVLSHSRALPTF